MAQVETVDEFLAALPQDQQEALQGLRDQLHDLIPGAQERLSYGVPTLFRERAVIAFGAAKKHCSLFVMSPPLVASLAPELDGFNASGGTVRFQPNRPIPHDLLVRIVAGRLAELGQ